MKLLLVLAAVYGVSLGRPRVAPSHSQHLYVPKYPHAPPESRGGQVRILPRIELGYGGRELRRQAGRRRQVVRRREDVPRPVVQPEVVPIDHVSSEVVLKEVEDVPKPEFVPSPSEAPKVVQKREHLPQSTASGNAVYKSTAAQESQAVVVPILKDSRVSPSKGVYHLDVETGNGIKMVQRVAGDTTGAVTKGGYFFTHPDGTVHKMSYVADHNGFQPSSDLLPVAPLDPHPIPPHALAQIEKARQEKEELARNSDYRKQQREEYGEEYHGETAVHHDQFEEQPDGQYTGEASENLPVQFDPQQPLFYPGVEGKEVHILPQEPVEAREVGEVMQIDDVPVYIPQEYFEEKTSSEVLVEGREALKDEVEVEHFEEEEEAEDGHFDDSSPIQAREVDPEELLEDEVESSESVSVPEPQALRQEPQSEPEPEPEPEPTR